MTGFSSGKETAWIKRSALHDTEAAKKPVFKHTGL